MVFQLSRSLFISICFVLFAAVSEAANMYQFKFNFFVLHSAENFEFNIYKSSQEMNSYEIQNLVQQQLKYMHGGSALIQPYGSPAKEISVHVTSIEPLSNTNSLVKISYEAQGQILVDQSLNASDLNTSIFKFYLPLNPGEVYKKSLLGFYAFSNYPCTNKKYKAEKYFWYYFNPLGANCPLEYGVDYFEVIADLKVINSNEHDSNLDSKWDKFYNESRRDSEFRMTIVFGLDDARKSTSPEESDDLMAEPYLKLKDWLTKSLNFTSKKWSAKMFANSNLSPLFKPGVNSLPHLETLVGSYGNKKIQIRMLFVPSSFPNNLAMGLALRQGFQEDHVVIYNGHAGFGENLNFDQFFQSYGLNFKKDYSRSNFIFLNSCSSFSYYQKDFQKLLPHSILMTNGLETRMKSVFDVNKKIVYFIFSNILNENVNSNMLQKLQNELSFQLSYVN